MNTTLKAGHVREILGVYGRAFNVILWPHRHGIANQTWGANRKNKAGETVAVEIRFDDNCKNGHSSFAITGTVYEAGKPRADRYVSRCGCVHDDIAETFPELAPLLKWHGTHTDEPLHYVANAVYLAGDRDHWGLRKGEPHPGAVHQADYIKFGNSPIWHPMKKAFAAWAAAAVARGDGFTVVSVPHENEDRSGDFYKFGDKYTFKGFDCKWHECPFDTVTEANEWGEALAGEVLFDTRPTLFGEGKARQLDAARAAAVWPEATDAELMQEPDALRAALIARLPALMEDFRRDMVEVCGFVWEDVRDPAKFV